MIQATAMVNAAAALWSAVPTAGAKLTNKGTLNEDVNGSNSAAIVPGRFAQPADLTPAAINYPLAVVYDADGAVIDTLFGTGTSDPTSCQNNGVLVALDNINPEVTIAHAYILLNGRCATTANLLQMMSFEIERAFGRILGLDYSQINRDALQNYMPDGLDGWPVMQPLSGTCNSSGGAFGGSCIPNPAVIRYDDVAALNRIYPITNTNLSCFPGKLLTASNTVSIRGVIAFRTGSGMQGVHVVARPLDANGHPMYQYTVSAVSGALYGGKRGNRITGIEDADGVPYARWGSNDADLQGAFDLSGFPLPPGVTTANYQLTFESIDPLFILGNSVGPYLDGQVLPSGTLDPVTVPNLSAGSTHISGTAAPSPITMRVLDMNGNAMTGGSVSLYQALYAWAPRCKPHVVCPPGVLLSTQTATTTSAIDGLVTFTPTTIPGVATNLQAIAVTGNTAVLPIEIERHP